MFTLIPFSTERFILIICLSMLFGTGLIAQNTLSHSSPTTVPLTNKVADVGAPILACSTIIPKGSKVIAEYFFSTYEYAYRRVAMFKAHGFEHATLMHTDCQSVDVEGDFYFVAISPIEKEEALLYKMMEPLNRQARKEGLKFGTLRIVRTPESQE